MENAAHLISLYSFPFTTSRNALLSKLSKYWISICQVMCSGCSSIGNLGDNNRETIMTITGDKSTILEADTWDKREEGTVGRENAVGFASFC